MGLLDGRGPRGDLTFDRDGTSGAGRVAWVAPGDVVIAGFSSYRGSVIAGSEWGAPMQRMPVPEAREGSWEQLFHAVGAEDKLLMMEDLDDIPAALDPRGHRAIGVVYHPERESRGNYVPSVLPMRYDAMMYIDRSHALRPLKMTPASPTSIPRRRRRTRAGCRGSA
jgi:erythromycin esterase